ncbi:MAG: hypothetical protein KatS3mg024_1817 [Armatimonadota bacterium]|nr:MAG: hypothetical protein KatS3mg024_1817 [Armatimonadota bacterium]
MDRRPPSDDGRPGGGTPEGVIRGRTIATHDLETLRPAYGYDRVQAVFARINPEGAVMDGTAADVVPAPGRIHAARKGSWG